MEIANASFDSMRRFVTGFRIPDLSRMWSGHDEVDYQVPSVPLIIKLEYYLVRCQELALWTDPKASLMALACIHLAFGYLATTVNTTLNLALWAVLSGFVYTTWTQRIWPEIRVPDEDGQEDSAQSAWTPVSPDVYSAPELIELLERLKSKAHELYQRAAALRTDSPGVFCVYASLSCLALGYLGTLMSTLALLYYLVVGSFVVPGLFKLLVTHQELSQLLSNLCNKKDSVDNQSDTRPAQSTITTSAAAVPEPENALTDQVSGMMQSVCSTLATGMATLTSQLPDMNQLEQKKQDLLSHDDSRSSDMEESMSPYLPDAQDLASHQILESCTRDSTFQDPTQPDSFQPGELDDDADILPSSMPSHDEIDTAHHRDMEERCHRQMSLSSMQATLGSSDDSRHERLTDDDEDDNKEFLPTAASVATTAASRRMSGSESSDNHEAAAQQLLLSETLDEDPEDSLLRSSFGQALLKEVAAAVDVQDVCGPVAEKTFEDLSSGDDDDFEVLSASEITSQHHDTTTQK